MSRLREGTLCEVHLRHGVDDRRRHLAFRVHRRSHFLLHHCARRSDRKPAATQHASASAARQSVRITRGRMIFSSPSSAAVRDHASPGRRTPPWHGQTAARLAAKDSRLSAKTGIIAALTGAGTKPGRMHTPAARSATDARAQRVDARSATKKVGRLEDGVTHCIGTQYILALDILFVIAKIGRCFCRYQAPCRMYAFVGTYPA